LLRFVNTQTNEKITIFSQTNEIDSLRKIGAVVCNEIRFDSFSSVNAVDVKSQLTTKFSAEQLLNHVNMQNINGLNCIGDESSLKECQPAHRQYDTTMPLFEINIECSCNFLLFEFFQVSV
jgi:hypothetical protein